MQNTQTLNNSGHLLFDGQAFFEKRNRSRGIVNTVNNGEPLKSPVHFTDPSSMNATQLRISKNTQSYNVGDKENQDVVVVNDGQGQIGSSGASGSSANMGAMATQSSINSMPIGNTAEQ